VKLLYAIASALFCVAAPVVAPAQSLDLSLMSALCSDDYYEDTAGQCGVTGDWYALLSFFAKNLPIFALIWSRKRCWLFLASGGAGRGLPCTRRLVRNY
jgi:hypothetical protein